jgi:chromosome segregation ATPase
MANPFAVNPFLREPESAVLAQILPVTSSVWITSTGQENVGAGHADNEGPRIRQRPRREDAAQKQSSDERRAVPAKSIVTELARERQIDQPADRIATLLIELQSTATGIKESYDSEMEAKDREIADLQERLRAAEQDGDELRAYVEELRASNAEHLASLKTLNDEFGQQLTR